LKENLDSEDVREKKLKLTNVFIRDIRKYLNEDPELNSVKWSDPEVYGSFVNACSIKSSDIDISLRYNNKKNLLKERLVLERLQKHLKMIK
jgi:predicted nucleotidyltransferase